MPEDNTNSVVVPPEKEESPKRPSSRVVSVERVETHEIYSGPLPPAEALAKYNDAFQNGAERVFQFAERQANHRMELEKFAISSDAKRSDRGLNCGVTVAIVGLLVAAFLGYFGQAVAATVIGSIDMVGLVSVFVYGTISRRTERTQKSKSMALVKPDSERKEGTQIVNQSSNTEGV